MTNAGSPSSGTTPDPADEIWNADPIELDDPRHRIIVEALGRLAVQSAAAEAKLRDAIYATYRFGDDVWMFTEGESAAWLVEKLQLIVRERRDDDEVLKAACQKCKGLFDSRNRFMHHELAVTESGRYVTWVSKRHKEIRPVVCSAQEIFELGEALTDTTETIYQGVAYRSPLFEGLDPNVEPDSK